METIETIEFKRPDQIIKVCRGEHKTFFIYSYRGVERAVFTDPNKAGNYAESPITSDLEPDYRVTLNDEEVQDAPEHLRQDMMDQMAMDYCDNNDINSNLINPYK